MLRVAVVLFSLLLSTLAIEPIPEARTGGGIQNFHIGKRQTDDKLIWSGNGNQAITFAKSITTDVTFPQYGVINKAAITQVVVTTTLDAGNTQVDVLSGGVGQKSISFRIKSNNARMVKYKIQIYGK